MMDIFFVCKYFYFPTAWLAERLSPAVPRDGWGWAGAAGQEGGPGLADQGDSANRIKSYAFLFNPVLTDLIRNDFSLTFLLWFLFLLTLWRTLHFFYDTIKPRARNATGYILCLKFFFYLFFHFRFIHLKHSRYNSDLPLNFTDLEQSDFTYKCM